MTETNKYRVATDGGVVTITETERQAARLRIRLYVERGQEVPEALWALAGASR